MVVAMIPRILAVEPDHESAHALRHFVQSCVESDLLLVDSAAAARDALDRFDPHVVLVSELLPIDDDIALTADVRARAAARALPILPVPPMGGAVDVDPAIPRGLLRLIASGGTLAEGPRTLLARRQNALREALRDAVGITVPGAAGPAAARARRTRALRLKGANIPWLTRVTMPLGYEVELVDISRSGLLIASRGQFVVGQPAAFELHGRRRVVVPGRFVRSTAADGNGIHRGAASFDADLPLFAHLDNDPRIVLPPAHDIGNVLAWVRAEARAGLPADRIRPAFELGVQELVGARDVHICAMPVRSDEPGDSMCLPVPTSDGSEAFLQAVYDPERPPSAMAFQRLKTFAALAADVLEMEFAARTIEAHH
jgi:hypothetical protein